MCRVLAVSRSGYDRWLRNKVSPLKQENEYYLQEIQRIYRASEQRYGSPRIHQALIEKGHQLSRPRVARIMRRAGIRSVIYRKFRICTTDSNHSYPLVENVLDRPFSANGPAQKWVSDISYIATAEGWAYLTIIMDLFDRRIVGWSLSKSLKAEETVLSAWRMAVLHRPIQAGLIYHSDRGVQYACHAFRE